MHVRRLDVISSNEIMLFARTLFYIFIIVIYYITVILTVFLYKNYINTVVQSLFFITKSTRLPCALDIYYLGNHVMLLIVA